MQNQIFIWFVAVLQSDFDSSTGSFGWFRCLNTGTGSLINTWNAKESGLLLLIQSRFMRCQGLNDIAIVPFGPVISSIAAWSDICELKLSAETCDGGFYRDCDWKTASCYKGCCSKSNVSLTWNLLWKIFLSVFMHIYVLMGIYSVHRLLMMRSIV